MKKRLFLALALILALPALARAPQVLSVVIDGNALSGKALWYDEQIYVPLRSVSDALDGDYSYDAQAGLAAVNFNRSGANFNRSNERPHLRVLKQQAFSTGDNMKVIATVSNRGLATADQIEVTCTFKSHSHNTLIASVAQLERLEPGERKTVEFWLYEQRIPSAQGGRPYAQPAVVPGAYQGVNNQQVYIGTEWTRVNYNLEFEFRNPDKSYSHSRG